MISNFNCYITALLISE